jgi:DNA repair protein RecO (recombination protein O)
MSHSRAKNAPFFDGFIIHHRPYLEKKLIVHVFTKEHGILPCIMHRSQKKTAQLQLFTPLACQIQTQSTMSQLKQIESRSFIPPLQTHFLFAGLYFNELLYRLCQANQAFPELYELYQSSIQCLSDKKNLTMIVRSFEHQLQAILGYSPNYHSIQQSPHTYFNYDPDNGLEPKKTISDDCFHRDALIALANDQLETPNAQQASKVIFSKLLKQLLGEKSLFIKQIMPKKVL